MPIYEAPKAKLGTTDPFSEAPKAMIDYCPWADYPTAPKAYGQVCYTKDAILVRLTAFEADPKITFFKPNEPVYEDSCLEFFINPLPGKDTFCDFECNANGTLLLGFYNEGDFGFLDPKTRPDFHVKASRANEDGEACWKVEYTIPASFLETTFEGFSFEEGGDIHINFYKCGDKTTVPHYSCWSPILSEKISFFRSEFFGTLLRK